MIHYHIAKEMLNVVKGHINTSDNGSRSYEYEKQTPKHFYFGMSIMKINEVVFISMC